MFFRPECPAYSCPVTYYTGGSLAFNIVTIYHPEEKMRRDAYNENDGGLLRYVYSDLEGYPVERGRLAAYWHDAEVATYAAADLTTGYWAEKARQVTRQFVYLRGEAECFVIFDRVESTDAAYPKTWFLHLPSEPAVAGSGDTCTWLSDAAGDTGLLATGRSRMIMRTLAPPEARITRRGGPGHDFWGHPRNPDAQYNHTLGRDGQEDPAYRRPPFSPWRLEVEPVIRQTLDHFLHLLYVTEEAAEAVPAAERIEEGNRLGARFQLGERWVTLLFDTAGPLGGHLTIRQGESVIHDAELAQIAERRGTA